MLARQAPPACLRQRTSLQRAVTPARTFTLVRAQKPSPDLVASSLRTCQSMTAHGQISWKMATLMMLLAGCWRHGTHRPHRNVRAAQAILAQIQPPPCSQSDLRQGYLPHRPAAALSTHRRWRLLASQSVLDIDGGTRPATAMLHQPQLICSRRHQHDIPKTMIEEVLSIKPCT